MTQYNLHDIHLSLTKSSALMKRLSLALKPKVKDGYHVNCTVSSNFLLDKGSVAKILQKECFCYFIIYLTILAIGNGKMIYASDCTTSDFTRWPYTLDYPDADNICNVGSLPTQEFPGIIHCVPRAPVCEVSSRPYLFTYCLNIYYTMQIVRFRHCRNATYKLSGRNGT